MNLFCGVHKGFRIFLFVVFLHPIQGWTQVVEKPFLLRGYVIGADTSNTIPLANILMKPSGERFISNRYGAFGIRVDVGDTLVFSVIGYQNYVLPVRKFVVGNMTDPIRVRLKPTTYLLKEAEVKYNQRHRDSMARRAATILKTSPVLNDYQHYGSWIGGSSGSVVSEIFAGSNRKLQEYNKVQRLIELYHEQEMVDERYTPDLIVRATGMKPEEVPAFKKFCNLPHYFILNSNDYDLVLAIRACFSDYTKRGR